MLVSFRMALVVFMVGWSISALAVELPVAGVVQFTTSAQNISCQGWRSDCNSSLGEGFRTMVETAIVKTKRMTIMERARMNTVMQEQVMSESGLVENGVELGGVKGIDYLVYGSITKFGQSKGGFSLAGSTPGSGIRSGRTKVEMEVDLKITDAQTSEIVVADFVGAVVQTGQSFNFAGIEAGGSSADPFADVQRVVAAKIAEAVVTTKFPVKVARVQSDGTIILNYGNVFFTSGDQLIAFELGEEFVDPDTGLVLGAEETEVGRIEVVSSDANVSRARVWGEPFDLSVGSVVKRAEENLKESRKAKRERERKKRW